MNTYAKKSSFFTDQSAAEYVSQRKTSGQITENNSGKITTNRTGMPDKLKSGIEQLSGFNMDGVRVHYNSPKPAQLHAHAYAQGTNIYLSSGQEKHLPHEAWHVVQQMQGRVKPTMQMKGGISINDDAGLEKEADVMGGKAVMIYNNKESTPVMRKANGAAGVIQCQPGLMTLHRIVRSTDIMRFNSPFFRYTVIEEMQKLLYPDLHHRIMHQHEVAHLHHSLLYERYERDFREFGRHIDEVRSLAHERTIQRLLQLEDDVTGMQDMQLAHEGQPGLRRPGFAYHLSPFISLCESDDLILKVIAESKEEKLTQVIEHSDMVATFNIPLDHILKPISENSKRELEFLFKGKERIENYLVDMKELRPA